MNGNCRKKTSYHPASPTSPLSPFYTTLLMTMSLRYVLLSSTSSTTTTTTTTSGTKTICQYVMMTYFLCILRLPKPKPSRIPWPIKGDHYFIIYVSFFL